MPRRIFVISGTDKDKINKQLRRAGYGDSNFSNEAEDATGTVSLYCDVALKDSEVAIWERICGAGYDKPVDGQDRLDSVLTTECLEKVSTTEK